MGTCSIPSLGAEEHEKFLRRLRLRGESYWNNGIRGTGDTRQSLGAVSVNPALSQTPFLTATPERDEDVGTAANFGQDKKPEKRQELPLSRYRLSYQSISVPPCNLHRNNRTKSESRIRLQEVHYDILGCPSLKTPLIHPILSIDEDLCGLSHPLFEACTLDLLLLCLKHL
jgi:hypothetical protein